MIIKNFIDYYLTNIKFISKHHYFNLINTMIKYSIYNYYTN